jgi:3-phosphoshikimate 1-carboxyvinyltransferase
VVRGVPRALDVARTAAVVGGLVPAAGATLATWGARVEVEDDVELDPTGDGADPGREDLEVQGSGRSSLRPVEEPLDCGNSGTTMRLVAGVVASAPFETTLTGDRSLRSRPMERVAEPLRFMGADVRTTGGRPPLTVTGGPLQGIRWTPKVPSAQVKGAVLLAGLSAEGPTEIIEPASTRDHTERALEALGAPVARDDLMVRLEPFQHGGFEGDVPGDVSSSGFLIAAALLTGSELVLEAVGLNPSRCRFLDVMRRMGADVVARVEGASVGEPIGTLHVLGSSTLSGTVVGAGELPLLIDEVPVLAVLAAHAVGESRFEGAAELRHKETDRLSGLAECIRELGGAAAVEGDALVVAGGGLAGGRTDSRGDHRLAMALTVGALGARGPSHVEGMEWVRISFPGFVGLLRSLGASIEVRG